MENVVEGKILSDDQKEKILHTVDRYNKGINKRAEKVAKVMVRKPKDGSTDVYDKYKKDMMKWMVAYKIGECALTSLVAIGPIDAVVKAGMVAAMARSDDHIDKAVMQKMDNLKSKIAAMKNKMNIFKSKVNKKDLDTNETEKQVKMLDAMASDVAKQIDFVNYNKPMKKAVNESTDLILSLESFIDTEKEVGIETYEAVIRFIDKADYSNDRDVLIIEKCIELLINDCNL